MSARAQPPLVPVESDRMLGETLGNYRIVSLIGQGGMGVVYLAEHTLLGRKTAVKLLRPEMSQELVERFFNEARAAATLKHVGIVDVFDFGHHTDGSAYIVMEYLLGDSLAERLQRDARLPIALAAVIVRQVASALHVAHQQGIIHRDLKPENIFLVADSDAPAGIRAKVLDFGIAKLAHEPVPRSVKTNSGAVFGTPRYMSPEQCKNARTVDGRADVYSLGCIFYEMLVGVALFDYDNWGELVGAHLHETPRSLREHDPTIPDTVEAIVNKMLAKRADDRYQSMQEVAEATESIWRAYAGGGPTPTFTPPLGIPADAMSASASSRSLAPSSQRFGSDPTLPAGSTGSDVKTDPIRRVARIPWMWIGGGVLGLGVIVTVLVLVLVLDRQRASERQRAFIVVDERDPDRGAPPPDAALDEVVAVPPDAAVLVADASSTVAATKPVVATETDTRQLTRAFGRQTAAVASCFKQHPGETGDAISLRFQIDVKGKVVVAEVLPARVAAMPLGACLARAARATTFGPQPKPVTFRVPIHTNVDGG